MLTSSKYYFILKSITKAISNAPYPYFLGVFHRIVILLRITGHLYFNHRHFPFALAISFGWYSYITGSSTTVVANEYYREEGFGVTVEFVKESTRLLPYLFSFWTNCHSIFLYGLFHFLICISLVSIVLQEGTKV